MDCDCSDWIQMLNTDKYTAKPNRSHTTFVAFWSSISDFGDLCVWSGESLRLFSESPRNQLTPEFLHRFPYICQTLYARIARRSYARQKTYSVLATQTVSTAQLLNNCFRLTCMRNRGVHLMGEWSRSLHHCHFRGNIIFAILGGKLFFAF